ncbi:hypothetical protein [Pseudonocardia sp. NPDC049635]|uniref:hypothetical protein n=1 Tax=Pseudonocardia sp. NPDC049635 TaxID=3155506 RepID=UPI0033E4A7C0
MSPFRMFGRSRPLDDGPDPWLDDPPPLRGRPGPLPQDHPATTAARPVLWTPHRPPQDPPAAPEPVTDPFGFPAVAARSAGPAGAGSGPPAEPARDPLSAFIAPGPAAVSADGARFAPPSPPTAPTVLSAQRTAPAPPDITPTGDSTPGGARPGGSTTPPGCGAARTPSTVSVAAPAAADGADGKEASPRATADAPPAPARHTDTESPSQSPSEPTTTTATSGDARSGTAPSAAGEAPSGADRAGRTSDPGAGTDPGTAGPVTEPAPGTVERQTPDGADPRLAIDPAAAAALAGAFAVDLLSWDEDDPARRARALGAHLASPEDAALLGWTGTGRQRADLVLPGRVRHDGGRVQVDVRVRVVPYRRVDSRTSAAPEPETELGEPAAAPAPSARGWRGLAARWVRIEVTVARQDDRLVVDAGPAAPPGPRVPSPHDLAGRPR